jgi:hypothetical protein
VLPEPGWLAPVVPIEPKPPARSTRLLSVLLVLFALATTVPPLLFVAVQATTVHR